MLLCITEITYFAVLLKLWSYHSIYCTGDLMQSSSDVISAGEMRSIRFTVNFWYGRCTQGRSLRTQD